jgi:3,4-dihydroxy-2-butanone 4-phosphate synthase
MPLITACWHIPVHICAMQVQVNEDPKATAFTVSVDAKFGTSTGISAGDRR